MVQVAGVDVKTEGRPAILFDRDGVLNVDEGYSYDPARLVWIEGAREAVKMVNDVGALAIVVTNQSGIGRGYYTEAQMHAFHAAISAGLAEIGARIDAFYFCPFHEDANDVALRIADHPDRKPNPGMLLRAIADHSIDTARTVMIGDKLTDMQAADRAGVPGLMFRGGDLAAVVRGVLPRLLG